MYTNNTLRSYCLNIDYFYSLPNKDITIWNSKNTKILIRIENITKTSYLPFFYKGVPLKLMTDQEEELLRELNLC